MIVHFVAEGNCMCTCCFFCSRRKTFTIWHLNTQQQFLVKYQIQFAVSENDLLYYMYTGTMKI